ncbi:PREDICTED: uncharacterized protein LOC104610867 [Nelumbo nucifera]|uniref:Uncharacterized protein LOC104610867 n=1 Tax=Nelumbo nucifera TaxID=4432 RepID=A0A1U8B4Y8_NELNU|nr:PREDICTED: uncharacterized protein LOC104610867 [Nelumbo nucifera]
MSRISTQPLIDKNMGLSSSSHGSTPGNRIFSSSNQSLSKRKLGWLPVTKHREDDQDESERERPNPRYSKGSKEDCEDEEGRWVSCDSSEEMSDSDVEAELQSEDHQGELEDALNTDILFSEHVVEDPFLHKSSTRCGGLNVVEHALEDEGENLTPSKGESNQESNLRQGTCKRTSAAHHNSSRDGTDGDERQSLGGTNKGEVSLGADQISPTRRVNGLTQFDVSSPSSSVPDPSRAPLLNTQGPEADTEEVGELQEGGEKVGRVGRADPNELTKGETKEDNDKMEEEEGNRRSEESKLMTFDKRWARSVWRVNGLRWVMCPSWGSSGGLITLWKDQVVEGVEELVGRFSISVKFRQVLDGFEWVLTNVYGPNDYKQRKENWEQLGDIRGLWEGPWCVGGDFNVIRFKEESNKVRQRSTTSMRKFNEFINAFELKELNISHNSFTWSNLQAEPFCSKLDRFLFTTDCEEHWGDLVSRALPRVTSDHWPIMIGKSNIGGSGPSPFRFENMWLLHLEFKDKVKTWWNESNPKVNWEGMKFHWKLKELKVKIKEWNSLHFGRLEEKKQQLISKIEELDAKEERGCFGDRDKEMRWKLKKSLEEIIFKEEATWRQKSRHKWVKEGDRNTKVFHARANGRRKKRTISKLVVDGTVLTQQQEIVGAFVEHFKSIFRKPLQKR